MIPTARNLIQSIEAVHVIRKGQVLGITRKNLHGQALGLRRWWGFDKERVVEREARVGNRSCSTSSSAYSIALALTSSFD
jgi:hypothetical protein